jgi:NADH-quinone oxidoreductase subunit H
MYHSIDYIDILVIIGKVIVAAITMILAAAFLSFAERKVVARIQDRIGPNRCGPRGIITPIADALKLMLKEDIVPRNVDKTAWTLAPIITVTVAMTVISIIPLGDALKFGDREILPGIADVNVGVLVFLALSSLGVYGVFLAGWSSNSKYSLLGAMRAGAQMISYELSMALAVATVCLWAGSLNLIDIINSQMNVPLAYFMGSVFVLIPHVIALLIFAVAIFAETNRAPFDLPECESELVAGFHTEYSGLRFAMFFLGEYINIIAGSALLVTLFLGGWKFPFGISESIMEANQWLGLFAGLLWFMIKLIIVLFFFIWVRATLPRLRYDQLMSFGWKFLFPVALGNLFLMAFLKLLFPGLEV